MTDQAGACSHEIWDMETAAVADGLCPLCLQERLRNLEEELRSRDDMLQWASDIVRELEKKVERLRTALQEISKGEGRYSRIPLEHASNTIEDMKALAVKALEEE